MATRSDGAKKRFLEHADVWNKVIAKHDDFVKQLAMRTPKPDAKRRAAFADRRLVQLYVLFGRKTPPIKHLAQWLAAPRPGAIDDFKFFLLHRALTTAIELASADDGLTSHCLSRWMYASLKQPVESIDKAIGLAATEGDAMSDGRGPSVAAVEMLDELGFGSERTIWRRLERHRKSIGEATPRPHRPRRPVPRR